MRCRMFALAFAGAFALAGALGGSQPTLRADELATVATADASAAVTEAPLGAGPLDGVPADGAACADGSCYGGIPGPGLFGHPARCLPHDYLNPHLFYNFYVGGNCNSIPAAMYPTPMPTPPLVGHTYFTYQPLYPHEYMYAHKRVYHRHYNYNRGLTRTRVIYAW